LTKRLICGFFFIFIITTEENEDVEVKVDVLAFLLSLFPGFDKFTWEYDFDFSFLFLFLFLFFIFHFDFCSNCSIKLKKKAIGPGYIGCYVDTSVRSMGDPFSTSIGSRTACYNICKGYGYRYYGLQAGEECRCGNNRDFSK